MSTTYIVDVYANETAAQPDDVTAAIRTVARTGMFYGGAWAYDPLPGATAHDAVGALVRFEVGLGSPYSGRPEALLRALKGAVRKVVGKRSHVDVRVLNADRATWIDGRPHR